MLMGSVIGSADCSVPGKSPMKFCRSTARLLLPGLLTVASLQAAPFDPLFRVVDIVGPCQVRKPGETAFENATRGRAYPYGTVVRTPKKSSLTVVLSTEDTIQVGPETVVTPAHSATGGVGKALLLEAGKLIAFTSVDNPPDALTVETPVAQCSGLSGRCEIVLMPAPDAFILTAVASSGGAMSLSGPQFTLPKLRAGYSVRIMTTRDQSLTRILNTLGDYTVLIDKGTSQPEPIQTTTRATIRIWREHAPIGGRPIVSVVATGADGKGRECFAFAVGQPLVASSTSLDWNVDDAAATNEVPTAESPAEAKPADAVEDGGDALWQ